MFRSKPFSVLITRPEHQSNNLVRLVESRGWQAVRFPTLDIAPVPRSVGLKEQLKRLQDFDDIVFISANAVNFALQANNGKIAPFKHCKIAAVGKSTAKALESAGIAVDWVPGEGFNSEALLAMPHFHDVEGHSVLIVRGEGGREKLADTLRDRGARVDYLEVYKRIKPKSDALTVVNLLKRGDLDVITVTSGEALLNLVDMIAKDARHEMLSVPLITISERMRELAENIGFKRIMIASGPDDQAIVEKVTTVCNGEECGRID